MNTITLSLLTLLLTVSIRSNVQANDGKFVEAMQKNIKAVYEAKEIADYQLSVNAFIRIASVEKSRWEPSYYTAFGYVMMANRENTGAQKDVYLDEALKFIEAGKKLAPSESELVALEGFVYMMKVTVDPASRGMIYAPKAMQTYSAALALNPENPRALAMMAQMQYGTSQFFGSPVTEACETNSKALEKFKTYQSDNILAPTWGSLMAESLKERCK